VPGRKRAGLGRPALLAWQRRRVKMHVSPLAIQPLPDARFLHRRGRWLAVFAEALIEPDVRNHGHVAHEPDVRGNYRGLVRASDAAKIEVELVECQAVNELALGFRLE